MRLLLTRAAEDAARTRAMLEALGHAVLVSPVLVFEPTGTPWPQEGFDGLVATSARAFSGPSRDAPDVRQRPLYLVGERTAAAARQAGFWGEAMVAPDGAALVAILRERPPQRLLYLAGVDRKPDVETGLAGAGHRLRVVETYAAVAATALTPEAVAALRDGAVDAVLHYSRRSAAIFVALASRAGLDPAATAHLCLSADVAVPLREGGCAAVTVAPTPDAAGLRSLLA